MSAEAIQAFKNLESQDLRILQVIEAAMAKHEYVPKEVVIKYSKFNEEETAYRLEKLHRLRLIRQTKQPYLGYALNYAGYDCLAINAFVKAGILEAFGKPLGVGKEADVYDALTPKGERIAIKFHRLGRISFRQTRRKRDWTREDVNWLNRSRKAAEKEYEALRILNPKKVAVPKPISQNRHAIAMSAIEGAELAQYSEIPEPEKVLREILSNVRKAYMKAGIIHADLSEYNIILKPDTHILIIDWPQYVTREHPNAQQLLTRDVENVLRFFKRKHMLEAETQEALAYVTGKAAPTF
ncbi:MAG: RIO1 family regulatory kinase/ATPase [Nitrososphaerota archaeon]|nr:AarF/UbiB family protein [Candidatus Bathyarchaeota archaeon]MDW8023990.1 RIO1 family regulatory kinase/ATPase [Nitrososphaerota archaeon]